MAFEPRHVPKGTKIGFTDWDGSQVELESEPLKGDDAYHVIRPTSQLAVEALDGIEAPVARKAIEAEKKGSSSRSSRGTSRGPRSDPQPARGADHAPTISEATSAGVIATGNGEVIESEAGDQPAASEGTAD